MWKKIKGFVSKHKKFFTWFVISCLVSFYAFSTTFALLGSKQEDIQTIPYTEFLKLAENGDVDVIYYNSSEEKMTVALYNDETREMSLEERGKYEYKNVDKRYTLYPAYEDFRKDMLAMDIRLVVDVSSSILLNILSSLVSFAVPIAFIIVMYRLSLAQTRGLNKNNILQTSNVKFSDVIGQDEVIEDIRFISDLIKNPNKGDDIGVKVPKGVLLSGAPGTGKTLIAKAVAGEAGVPFISVGGSDFKELFVGMGAKRVRDLFKIAKDNSPCIVFIDEIDSVGVRRDARTSGSEDDSTINALLKEMDGFTGREGVFVLAATNHPEKLDKALIRAGRFDRRIDINPPRDWEVRKELFNHYLADLKVSDDVDVDNLAKTVSGFTGADIAMVCNEAGIIAMMKDKTVIDNVSIEEAIDKVVFHGNRSKKESFKKDKEIVAYHESGHAVMSYLLNSPISRASIIGTTSGVGGAVFHEDKQDTMFTTRQDLVNKVMIQYSGRISEEIKFKEVTTGAENDIQQATNVLLSYLEYYGFDEEFGILNMEIIRDRGLIESNNSFNRLVKMSKEIYNDASILLNKHFDKVELLANKLLVTETLSGSEIEELLKNG